MKQGTKHRIAVFTHGDRNIGGGERFLSNFVLNLDRNHFDPILLYSKNNIIVRELSHSGVPTKHFFISSRLTSVYRDQVSWRKPGTLFLQGLAALSVISRLRSYLRQNKIDVLYVHDNLSKILGVPAARLAGTKIITVCHDQLGKSTIDRLLLAYQKLFMDKVFCVSRYVGQSFFKKWKNEI